MNYKSIKIQNSGWFLISTAVLMLSFWVLFAVFLPMQEDYVNWVLDKDWTWINLIGFIGSLMGIFALDSLFLVLDSESNTDYVGYFMAVSGVVGNGKSSHSCCPVLYLVLLSCPVT